MYIKGKYLLAGLNDFSECISIRSEVIKNEQDLENILINDDEDDEAIFAIAYEATEGDSIKNSVATGRLSFMKTDFNIGKIAVKKEYRRKKYGDFIVRMLVDKAFSMGAREVFADVNKAVIPFFESIGFTMMEQSYVENDIFYQRMKISPCSCKRECRKD